MAYSGTDITAPKIDLYAAKRVLAGRLMQNTTQSLIFRDGYGLTEEFSNDVMAAQLRILRHRRPTIVSRSLAGGTNDAHFNANSAAQPATKEYGLDLIEVYDNVVDIPTVLENMINIGVLNLESQGIEDQLTRLVNAYTFAKQIAAALNRDAEAVVDAGAFTATTLIKYDPDADSLTDKFFTAHNKLDEGAEEHDIDVFKQEGRVAVFLPSAKQKLLVDEKSVFEVGSSRAVQLLEIGSAGGLETVSETDVTGFFGTLNKTPLHLLSKPLMTLVEGYLGLDKGDLSKVVGMVVASEATGRGIAFQNSIKAIDAPSGQGIRLQPLTRWGVEVWVPEGIQLIVEDDFVNPAVTLDGQTPDEVAAVGIAANAARFFPE
jgi:hypothetical protein